MPPQINEIRKALSALHEFRRYAISPFHERFIFPFLCGSYFTYRKIDVHRIVSIAKTISENPTYLDAGCGYGDFLEKIREYIPEAEGIEKSVDIFYSLGRIKPKYIKIADAYNGSDKN
jgi:SAM-dependent methyltransferase